MRLNIYDVYVVTQWNGEDCGGVYQVSAMSYEDAKDILDRKFTKEYKIVDYRKVASDLEGERRGYRFLYTM